MDQRMRAPSADLLLEHAAFLRRLARRLLGDEYAADDVVQETLLTALSRPPKPGNLRAWLARVAPSLALRRLRGEGRRARRERVAARSERLPPAAEGVTRLEIQRRVVDAVLALEEPYRTVIVQRFLHDRTIREVARLLDTPVETVRTRQRRALEQLRRRLDAAYGNRRAQWSIALLAFARPPRGGPLSIAVERSIAMATKWTLAAVLLIARGLFWATLEMRGGRNLPAAPAPRQEVTLRVQAKGFAPIERLWCQAGARVRIVVGKGIRFLVRAVDASGAGVEGVRLQLWKAKDARNVEAGGDHAIGQGAAQQCPDEIARVEVDHESRSSRRRAASLCFARTRCALRAACSASRAKEYWSVSSDATVFSAAGGPPAPWPGSREPLK